MPEIDRDALYRKVSLRIIPFMILLYLVSFLDRVNVGFAALTMNADLGISPYVFGWGAGIFFFGYFLFEVPSNVILEKVGARLWICRIMLTWGLISAAMAFVQGVWSYSILRFLLGAAEAGFLPGMILYLTYWFPSARRARFVALFMAAVPLASAIGAPVSGLILGSTHEWLGLKGWQWLFIIEGLPACLLGLAVLALLPDGPARAPWLSDAERAAITADLAGDRAASAHPPLHALWPALADLRVLLLGLVYFGIVIGLYGIGLWLPQIVKGMGFTTVETGWIIALPYLVSAGAMLVWGRHSDRSGERILHVALPALLSAIGFIGSIYASSNVLALVCLGVAAIGIYATLGPFWTMPPVFLGGTAAAGGIALINSIGNLGGFVGPYAVGWIKDSTGSFTAGMGFLAGGLVGAAVIALLFGRLLHRRAMPPLPG
ncbi:MULTISPECIES: MFS transporter [Inquilinus]|uniref:ACS family tartrate transporter-like MFS transporter n=1 Tax=Inquilinus ginsengisoli TaxID=363840 RepID=A0ABU1JTR8_9PROT|nr:MFS transporter [Inquilinus ginsengisoli]MDR6290974.1 ACS family tartrate transporter-like MFS transporter [Inquilinus ginsengisoli]